MIVKRLSDVFAVEDVIGKTFLGDKPPLNYQNAVPFVRSRWISNRKDSYVGICGVVELVHPLFRPYSRCSLCSCMGKRLFSEFGVRTSTTWCSVHGVRNHREMTMFCRKMYKGSTG